MEKSPFIGQLDRRIQIVELVGTRNTTGEIETTENAIAMPYAKMVDVSGSEEVDGKVRHLINRTYIIRYNALVKAKANELIIIDGLHKFNVYHIKEIGRKKHLELLVKDYE
jgi:head-tail adaptor